MLDPETKLKFFEDTVTEVVKDLGYADISVNFKNISEYGVNYLGDIIKVKVSGTKNGILETVFFVIKAVPDNQVMRTRFKVDEKFFNEVTAYSKLLPAFEELQKKYNVREPLKNLRVFKIITEEFKEMLLMYDLSSSGFDFEQSRIGKQLDLEHARSVVTNIGKMHALSFATNKYSPGLLKKTLTALPEILTDTVTRMMMKNGLMMAIATLEDPVAKAKISEILPTVDDFINNSVENSHNIEPYAVLVHGDLWANNIMFKYEGDSLVESVLLDWQIIRYHTPIIDLLFFLFTSVEDDARTPNFQSLLDLYYSALSEYLKELKCNPDELFSRQAFEEQLKKFTKFSLLQVLLMLPLFTGPPMDPTTFDPSDMENSKKLELTEVYKKRLNAIFKDLAKHGLF